MFVCPLFENTHGRDEPWPIASGLGFGVPNCSTVAATCYWLGWPGPLWNDFGMMLRSIWDNFRKILGRIFDVFGMEFGMAYGMIFGWFWNELGMDFDTIFG